MLQLSPRLFQPWLVTWTVIWTMQARSKPKMTGGGEWVAHVNSPPRLRLKRTSWYMSGHYICLQYLLFLSLIFRLCWLWRNRELVWDIVRENFAKQLLSVFSPPSPPMKSLATSTRVGASVPSLWTCNIMRYFSLESPLLSSNTSSPALKPKTIFHQLHWLLAWRVTAFSE